ncbi:single-stranded DNA-binding protein [Desulforegula conservatrix]|uniref:single-stranded DNA-binding protein n=1 Tax=Desulforegula conservatrix TaxID=153026 RepID=UPI0003F8BD24|nr:single-stranded DNA-binding protein [Desulforegula conservatrix]
MAGVNKVIIMGNLGRDPELSYTQGGMAVCKFSIATSKRKKDGTDVTSWHRCTAFGRTAEIITQYVGKGSQLYVEGELSYGQYEKDGIVRYTTDIYVNEFAFVGAAKGGQQSYDSQMGQPPQQSYQPPQQNFQAPQQQYQQRPNQQQAFNQPPQQQQNYQQAPPSYPEDDFTFTPPKDDDIPF